MGVSRADAPLMEPGPKVGPKGTGLEAEPYSRDREVTCGASSPSPLRPGVAW